MITSAFEDALAALFLLWRRAVTRTWHAGRRFRGALRNAAGHWVDAWSAELGYILHPGRNLQHTDARRGVVAGFGVLSFVAGMLLAIGIAVSRGDRPAAIVGVIAVEIAWTVARFWVLTLVLRDIEPRESVAALYLAGLVPYALAATPVMRFGALALSALLTSRGLLGAGIPSADARTATAWAFSGQVLVLLLGFVMRGALAMLVLV